MIPKTSELKHEKGNETIYDTYDLYNNDGNSKVVAQVHYRVLSNKQRNIVHFDVKSRYLGDNSRAKHKFICRVWQEGLLQEIQHKSLQAADILKWIDYVSYSKINTEVKVVPSKSTPVNVKLAVLNTLMEVADETTMTIMKHLNCAASTSMVASIYGRNIIDDRRMSIVWVGTKMARSALWVIQEAQQLAQKKRQ